MKSYPLRQEYLICYDIEDNKIRTSVFKELEKYGLKPVQKSVFWGYLTMAEQNGIKRYLDNHLNSADKAFIAHSYLQNKVKNYFIGYAKDDFTDWREADVI